MHIERREARVVRASVARVVTEDADETPEKVELADRVQDHVIAWSNCVGDLSRKPQSVTTSSFDLVGGAATEHDEPRPGLHLPVVL